MFVVNLLMNINDDFFLMRTISSDELDSLLEYFCPESLVIA